MHQYHQYIWNNECHHILSWLCIYIEVFPPENRLKMLALSFLLLRPVSQNIPYKSYWIFLSLFSLFQIDTFKVGFSLEMLHLKLINVAIECDGMHFHFNSLIGEFISVNGSNFAESVFKLMHLVTYRFELMLSITLGIKQFKSTFQ